MEFIGKPFSDLRDDIGSRCNKFIGGFSTDGSLANLGYSLMDEGVSRIFQILEGFPQQWFVF